MAIKAFNVAALAWRHEKEKTFLLMSTNGRGTSAVQVVPAHMAVLAQGSFSSMQEISHLLRDHKFERSLG